MFLLANGRREQTQEIGNNLFGLPWGTREVAGERREARERRNRLKNAHLGLNLDLSWLFKNNKASEPFRNPLASFDLYGTGIGVRTQDLWIHNPAL